MDQNRTKLKSRHFANEGPNNIPSINPVLTNIHRSQMIPAINSQLFRSATAKHRRTDTGRGLFLDTWLWRWALVEGIITMVVLFVVAIHVFLSLHGSEKIR